jgi:transposase-like protein
VGRGSNIVSALVEAVTRLVVQELLEGEQADYLGGRGRYERRGEGQSGSRNGYESGRVRTAEGAIEVAVPQVRGVDEPFRSSLMGFLDGNSEVLERLVCEMYARGLSTRDVEDAFRSQAASLLPQWRRSQGWSRSAGPLLRRAPTAALVSRRSSARRRIPHR